MSKKGKFSGNIVYSTNPDFRSEDSNRPEQTTLPPPQQDLRVLRDSRHRGGKTVTLITGFIGREEDLKDLGKLLKTKCGTGGTVKDGEIIIQGDFREKIFTILTEAKYKVKKAGG
ncbi:MAG TPA: translation initiation factor [Bacteroidia bacterium]|nr:translation initiation factor [Bacteroidia bacterium]